MIEQIQTAPWAVSPDVEALHQRCGVYTRSTVVCTLLDAVGWTEHEDLSTKRLLEPAAGDGAFIVEAAERLLLSIRHQGIPLTLSMLEPRIRAFEIHPLEATRARARIREILQANGLPDSVVEEVAQIWVRAEDFLLADIPKASFTQVVGNPPYSRWSKIPAAMRLQYESELPRYVARGDLFLPFLDLGIDCLQDEGRLGFICTDRWRYMAFAEGFRRERLPEVVIERDETIDARAAYVRDVDTYPSLLVMRRSRSTMRKTVTLPEGHGVTLAEAGYQVRVGPALGITSAFVLESGENDVENELLAPWVNGVDIVEGAVNYRGRRVIAMYDEDGVLRNLDDYPRAGARLESFRSRLENRSIVRKGAVWYRPIDRVVAGDWHRPKLLIPELSRVPRVAFDTSGAIPSHGVYAIFTPNNDPQHLYEILRDGGLYKLLDGQIPSVKGKYRRLYKHFLDRLVLEG